MAAAMGRASGIIKMVIIGLVVVLVIGAIVVLTGAGTRTGTVYFARANNIYPGDAIRILGMEVGAIDKVTPEPDKVRIDFHYDNKYALPADVKAAILSPTLVATRFIQLDPPYSGGPEFPDGGTIPVERTAAAVEFDELKRQLDQLSDALGPKGADANGALKRALDTIEANGVYQGVGYGQNFHDMVVELSKAAKTLSDGRGDLFGTVSNLSTFTSVLSRYDATIVEFSRRLADVAGILNDNSKTLRELLPKVDDAGKQVDKLLTENGPRATKTIDRAASISRSLAKRRMDIAQALHIGPNAIINFANIFNPRTGAIFANVTANNTASFGSPGDGICTIVATTAGAANANQSMKQCVATLGPVFRQIAFDALPVGAHPLVAPTGSTPTYGGTDNLESDTSPSPNGSNSDIPGTSTRNDNQSGPAGLGGLLEGGN